MKKTLRFTALLLAAVLLMGMSTVCLAEQPNGWWPYFQAYQSAMGSGDVNEILKTGTSLLNFYAGFDLNSDIAEMCYNVYYYRYVNNLYENRGDYSAAQDNLRMLIKYSRYLGFADTITLAESRIEKLDPMTEVYIASDDPADAIHYGAKYEPVSGSYFGRVERRDSSLKSENSAAISDEAIVSFYVTIGESSAKRFDWKIKDYTDDGHVIHLAMNLPDGKEAACCAEIITGKYDANIMETLNYVAKLKDPVLLRFGAEMNVWSQPCDADTFKKAYIHVAKLARSICPNAALVFSVNYASRWGEDMMDYYPGDEYVDWVGMSLYMNSASAGSKEYEDAYFGRGRYCDCVLNAKETVEKFGDRKPIIVSEGGALYTYNGADQTAHAANQVRKMYSVLNMVYPQIKAIIYFDTAFNSSSYILSGSPTVQAAYNSAIYRNPTLISEAGGKASTYVKLTDYKGKTDAMYLASYSRTIYGNGMTVGYYLDGKKLSSDAVMPFYCTITGSSVTAGTHTLKVTFDDGSGYKAEKTYTISKLMDGRLTIGTVTEELPAAWAIPEVTEAINLGLINEKFRTKYTEYITREDFCELVLDLIEAKSGKSIDSFMEEKGAARDYTVFDDTNNPDIFAANALGIVSGKGNCKFKPADKITRQEAAKMLTITANLLGMFSPNGESIEFADKDQFAAWAVDGGYITFISAVHDKVSGSAVMGGTGGNFFSPTGPYTRQQAYLTMLRLFRAL